MFYEALRIECATTAFAFLKYFVIVVVKCCLVVLVHGITLELLSRFDLNVIHIRCSFWHWPSLMFGFVAFLCNPFLFALRNMDTNRRGTIFSAANMTNNGNRVTLAFR